MPARCTRLKILQLVSHLTSQGIPHAAALTCQAQTLHHDLKQVMRCFGRQCRGQGKVLLRLVRETETRLLAVGQPIVALAPIELY